MQEERDRVLSDLVAQVRWSEEEAARLGTLKDERDRARSDLAAQVRWSEEAVERHTELRARFDEQYRRLHDVQNALDGTRVELAQAIESLEAVRLEYHQILGSLSWRLTRPLRALRFALLPKRPSKPTSNPDPTR